MAAIASLEGHHEPTQRLTRLEALKLHRVGSARLGHQDAKKGVLEPGRHADFAAYDGDPLEVETVEGLGPSSPSRSAERSSAPEVMAVRGLAGRVFVTVSAAFVALRTDGR